MRQGPVRDALEKQIFNRWFPTSQPMPVYPSDPDAQLRAKIHILHSEIRSRAQLLAAQKHPRAASMGYLLETCRPAGGTVTLIARSTQQLQSRAKTATAMPHKGRRMPWKCRFRSCPFCLWRAAQYAANKARRVCPKTAWVYYYEGIVDPLPDDKTMRERLIEAKYRIRRAIRSKRGAKLVLNLRFTVAKTDTAGHGVIRILLVSPDAERLASLNLAKLVVDQILSGHGQWRGGAITPVSNIIPAIAWGIDLWVQLRKDEFSQLTDIRAWDYVQEATRSMELVSVMS